MNKMEEIHRERVPVGWVDDPSCRSDPRYRSEPARGLRGVGWRIERGIDLIATGMFVVAAGILCAAVGCGIEGGAGAGLAAGQDVKGPWWMRETALTREGKLDLTSKPWWPRAAGLRVGEQFIVDAQGEAKDRMLVRRERITTRDGKTVEAIVWVIDDGGDGSALRGGDQINDCYVADYNGDGVVDRMVDWIDNDNDGVPDEMDIRYFTNGALNYCWFGADYDHDGKMWSLAGYEYGGPSFFEADPYGNNMIWMNKFDPTRGTWGPISECPFAFYDTDGDGESEVVVRVSAVPLDYDRSEHPDYANNQYVDKWKPSLERMGIVNIRYGFDVDGLSGKDYPLHYDFGYNLVGATPYKYTGINHYNPLRRPPQVTVVTPYERVRSIADHFEAAETGLSWHENFDDTIKIGYGPHAEENWRWEGVFWIWERRFMENTGGPNQKWNVRREWRSRPSATRELYLSGIDGRLHLVGAEEGWIEVGHFGGLERIGEVRMFDTDGNGYFDRWEVYLGDSSQPARVTTVRNEKVTRLGPFDYERTRKLYTEQVLPQAMAANERIMAAMTKVREYKLDEKLQAAMTSGPPNFRRYAQDVACELQYQDLREYYTKLAQGVLDRTKMNDLRTLTQQQRERTGNSYTAWRLLRVLERLDAAFGEGDVDGAIKLLEELNQVKRPLE